MTLWTVLSRVHSASLWNTMMTLVSGKSTGYSRVEHLQHTLVATSGKDLSTTTDLLVGSVVGQRPVQTDSVAGQQVELVDFVQPLLFRLL